MSESWISRSLVVVQVSVSSSWRLAHSANTETMPMIVARTIRMIGTAREPRLCAVAGVVSDSPIKRNPMPSGRRTVTRLG